jgi:hypothetical protein
VARPALGRLSMSSDLTSASALDWFVAEYAPDGTAANLTRASSGCRI